MGPSNIKKDTVLVIFPSPLIPTSGGGQTRALEMIDHLRRKGYRVELITRTHDKGLDEVLSKRVDNLLFYSPPPKGRPRKLLNMLRHQLTTTRQKIADLIFRRMNMPEYDKKGFPVLNTIPVYAIFSKWLIKRLDPNLLWFVGKESYNLRPAAAIVYYAWNARCLDLMPPGTLRILDTIDVQHIRADVAKTHGGDLESRSCTREEEINELSRADVLLAIESGEQAILKDMCPDKDVILAEHGLMFDKMPSPSTNTDLLFVGNLYDPNIKGITGLLENAWPRIRSEFPESRLFICGRVCEALDRNVEGVFYDGVVPNLLPYYQMASIVINPVPYGTGLNIKTVEALAYGKCLVSTAAGAKGIINETNEHFVLSEADAMAEAVTDLMGNPDKRRKVEDAAWSYARQRFNPERTFSGLTGAIEKHVRRLD